MAEEQPSIQRFTGETIDERRDRMADQNIASELGQQRIDQVLGPPIESTPKLPFGVGDEIVESDSVNVRGTVLKLAGDPNNPTGYITVDELGRKNFVPKDQATTQEAIVQKREETIQARIQEEEAQRAQMPQAEPRETLPWGAPSRAAPLPENIRAAREAQRQRREEARQYFIDQAKAITEQKEIDELNQEEQERVRAERERIEEEKALKYDEAKLDRPTFVRRGGTVSDYRGGVPETVEFNPPIDLTPRTWDQASIDQPAYQKKYREGKVYQGGVAVPPEPTVEEPAQEPTPAAAPEPSLADLLPIMPAPPVTLGPNPQDEALLDQPAFERRGKTAEDYRGGVAILPEPASPVLTPAGIDEEAPLGQPAHILTEEERQALTQEPQQKRGFLGFLRRERPQPQAEPQTVEPAQPESQVQPTDVDVVRDIRERVTQRDPDRIWGQTNKIIEAALALKATRQAQGNPISLEDAADIVFANLYPNPQPSDELQPEPEPQPKTETELRDLLRTSFVDDRNFTEAGLDRIIDQANAEVQRRGGNTTLEQVLNELGFRT